MDNQSNVMLAKLRKGLVNYCNGILVNKMGVSLSEQPQIDDVIKEDESNLNESWQSTKAISFDFGLLESIDLSNQTQATTYHTCITKCQDLIQIICCFVCKSYFEQLMTEPEAKYLFKIIKNLEKIKKKWK
jgi:hypothetical protein